jgi:fatty-acyl-CoA synthase
MADVRRTSAEWPDRTARRVAPTLAAAVEALANTHERGFTFVDTQGAERFYSFHALHAEALKRSHGLRRLGLKKGERISLIVAESDDFVLTLLGAVLAGVVPVPIYPRVGFKASDGYVDSVAHITNAAGSAAIVTTEQQEPHVRDAVARCPSVKQLIDMKMLAAAAEGEALPPVEVTPDDIAFLQFTSGSTSLPKGVVVKHRNLAANCRAFMYEGLQANPQAGDKGISWLPLFHDMGLIGFVFGPLFTDIPVVFLPTSSFARSPRVWLEAAHRHRATLTYAPNFGYALAAKRLKDRDLQGLDLSCLRVAGCGAEPIQVGTLRAFADKLAPTGFKPEYLLPCYGMAEGTLAISFTKLTETVHADRVAPDALQAGKAIPVESGPAADGAPGNDIVCCGTVFENHEVRIVDDAGNPLGERQVGQIITRGPSVCETYYQNPEASAESFKQGWLYTGDLGYLAKGELYICGRLKDVIIVRGRNFYPQDIEWCVAQIEGTRRDNVVAFGITEDGEEKLVILAETSRMQAGALREEIPKRVLDEIGLSPFKVELVALGTLPKTSSGKPQRRKTKALWASGQFVASTHGAAPNGAAAGAQEISE